MILSTVLSAWAFGQVSRVSTQAVLLPPETRIFIELNGLGDRLPEFRTVFLDRFLNWSTGREGATEGNPFWVQVIGSHLNLSPDQAFDLLFQHRVTLASPIAEGIESYVMLFQLQDPAAMKTLLGTGTIQEVRKGKRVRVYRSLSGLMLAATRSTLAVSQGATPFFEKITSRMDGDDAPSLFTRSEFQGSVQRVRNRRDGIVFVDLAEGAALIPELADFRSLAIGIQVKDLQVDLQLEGIRREPRSPANPPGVRVERVSRLPGNSILAWSGWTDFSRWYIDALKEGPRTLRGLLVRSAGNQELIRMDFFGKIGPRYIFVWGESPVSNPGSLPRLAILIESSNTRIALTVLKQALHNLFRHPQKATAKEGEKAGDSTVTVVYNEISITSIRPGANWIALLNALGIPGTFDDVEICFAEVDGWVAIALYPDHLRAIIDGWKNRIQTIGSSGSMDSQKIEKTRAVTLGLANLADGLETLRVWFDPTSPQNSPFADFLTTGRPATTERRLLGIGMRVRQAKGQVIISRVYRDGPAAGVLLPGDAIIGVNDQLLSLENPNEDFKTRIRQSKSRHIRLRVLRQGAMVEAGIHLDHSTRVDSSSSPVEALRRIMHFFSDITTAEVIVHSARPNRYSANISLTIQHAEKSKPSPGGSE